jgi:hypothetical protein
MILILPIFLLTSSHDGEDRVWTSSDTVAALLTAPVLETFALLLPTIFLTKLTRHAWLAAVIGAAPLILLHFLNGWQNVVGVLWLFTWSAYCCVYFRRAGRGFWGVYSYLALLHAGSNLFWILLILVIELWR